MQHLIEHCDLSAEQYMRIGQWDLAKDEYMSCPHLETSELVLRMATLEWRKDCAKYISNTYYAPIPLSDFVQDISRRYDKFIAEWFVKNYQGIQIVQDGNTYAMIPSIQIPDNGR